MKLLAALIQSVKNKNDVLCANDISICGSVCMYYCKSFNHANFKTNSMHEIKIDAFYYYIKKDKKHFIVIACDSREQEVDIHAQFADFAIIAKIGSQSYLEKK